MEPKRKDKSTIIITDAAMAAANAVLGVYGVKITKKDLVERLLIWFSEQSDVVQASLLGILPASQRVDIARRELERMASTPPAVVGGGPAVDEKLKAAAASKLAGSQRGQKAG